MDFRMNKNFRSDNEAPVAPEIIEALHDANEGFVYSYGEDQATAELERQVSELFETRVQVWPLSSGTAANSLAMAQICPPYGSIYCHSHSHIHTDECGAPGFYTGGGTMVGLDGENGKLSARLLSDALSKTGQLDDHEVCPLR